jgi:L-ascorbate metabolism protein UlaG (beta-lactamase superfamily)
VVEADGLNLYFSGDTRDFPALRSALSRRSLDVALVQIACARYFGRADGMDVASAAAFLREVKPKIAIPMHYDGRFKEADPNALAMALEGSGIEVRVLAHGREELL